MSNVEIVAYNTYSELAEEIQESYLDLQEALHQVSNRGEILRTRSFRKQRLLEPRQENHKSTKFLAIDDDQLVGVASTFYREMEDDPNPEALELHVAVHPQFRRQGIAKQLLAKLFEVGQTLGRTKYEAWIAPVDGDAGVAFCQFAGLQKATEERSSRMYRTKINWEYIKEQRHKHRETLEKYRFVMIDRKTWAEQILDDDDLAKEMADFITETVNLIPKEEMEANDFLETVETLRQSARQILKTPTMNSINYYAFDNTTIIGMSGTFFPDDPPVRDVQTGLTAVRKAYQRQGLASLMKAMIIQYFVDHHPEFEYISTENAQSNKGMLAINHNLGFEYAFSWEMWQKKT